MQGRINSGSRLRRAGYFILPGYCIVCRDSSERGLDLCQPCESDLPRLGPHCRVCAAPLALTTSDSDHPGHQPHCGQCLKKPPHYDRVIAPFVYGPPLDRLLSRFKFNSDLVAGRVLGQLLTEALRSRMEGARMTNGAGLPFAHRATPDWIIPAPLHWQRNLFRGFNQARELAEPLSKALQIPVAHRLVKRSKATTPQHRLKRAQRRQNLRHAFTLASQQAAGSIEGRSFAVVDDILTTGSTAEAIASVLKKHGAAEVSIWVVARTRLEN